MLNKLVLTILITVFFTNCKSQDSNVEILDIVWGTINTEYFDSTFNGLDWQAEWNQKDLLNGVDTQLEKAIEYLSK